MLVHTALTRAGDIMALSANLLEVQEMLRNISMQEVQQVASGQSGKANQLLGMDELKRRAEIKSEAQGADAEAQQGQPPMIDQYLQMSQQAMGQGPPPPPQMPQGMPQMPQMPQGPPPSQQGIGSMMPPPPQRQMPQGMPPGMGQGMPQGPPPQMGMAGGGSVRGYAGPTGSRVGDPSVVTRLDRQFQGFTLPDAEEKRYIALVRQDAINRGMDPDLAVAQIMQDRNGRSRGLSPTVSPPNEAVVPPIDGAVVPSPGEAVVPSIDAGRRRKPAVADVVKTYRGNPPSEPSVIWDLLNGRWAENDGADGYETDPTEEDPNYYASIMPDLNYGGNIGPMFGDSHRGINFGFGPSVEQGTEAYDQAVEQLDRIKEVERLGAMTPDLERKRVKIQNMMPSGFLEANSPNSFAEVGKIYSAYLNSPQMKLAREQEGIDNQARRKLGAPERTTSSIQTFGDPTATDDLTVNRTTPPGTDDDTPKAPAVEKMRDATDKAREDIENKNSQQAVIGDTPPEGAGFMESLKDGKYKSLFDFMMMSGLQYASGSNIGEAGVAGLGYLGEQQVMDNQAGRRALQDRASQATIALSEEKTRRLKAGMSMTELRQEALKILAKDESFSYEKDPSLKEDMIQQTIAMIVGSGSGGANRVVVGQGGGEV